MTLRHTKEMVPFLRHHVLFCPSNTKLVGVNTVETKQCKITKMTKVHSARSGEDRIRIPLCMAAERRWNKNVVSLV